MTCSLIERICQDKECYYMISIIPAITISQRSNNLTTYPMFTNPLQIGIGIIRLVTQCQLIHTTTAFPFNRRTRKCYHQWSPDRYCI